MKMCSLSEPQLSPGQQPPPATKDVEGGRLHDNASHRQSPMTDRKALRHTALSPSECRLPIVKVTALLIYPSLFKPEAWDLVSKHRSGAE